MGLKPLTKSEYAARALELAMELNETKSELAGVLAQRPKCAHCDAPATCLGSYEMSPWEFACSGCCGHGNEDGKCVRLEEIPELYRRKLEVERLELEAP